MKKLYRRILKSALSIMLIALLLTVTACGSSSTGSSGDASGASSASSASGENAAAPEGTGEEALAAEQVLNLTHMEVERLDVNDVRNGNEFQILGEVYEGLFRTFTDENGLEVVENAGCTSYEVSDDNLTYTFHLREESVWSDGEPVVAQNYVDSWLRLIDPEGAFPYAILALGIEGAEAYYNGEGSMDDVAIKAIDEHTFSVTLDAPDSTFIKKVEMVCFYPIRKDLIDAAEANGGDWTNDYTLHVFNGPFVISDRVLENSMTLTKNETYWNADSVILTQVNFRVVDETATQAQLMETQQMDILSLSDLEYIQQWQPLVDDGTLVHVTTNTPSVRYLVLNQHEEANGGTSGLMQNEKVRLAMALALDREEYVELFREGLSMPAYGLIPYNMAIGDTEYRSYHGEPLLSDEYAALAADPDALRALFEEGCLEEGHSGNAADETLTTMVYNPSTQQSNELEWFKQQFESKLGCNVEIMICPDLSSEQAARANYEYDFYVYSWGADYDDPLAFLELFLSDGSYAQLQGGFSDAEYDSLIDQFCSSLDNDERLELCAQAEEILLTSGGTIPIYYGQGQVYYQSYVKNLSLPLFGPSYEFSRAYIAEH